MDSVQKDLTITDLRKVTTDDASDHHDSNDSKSKETRPDDSDLSISTGSATSPIVVSSSMTSTHADMKRLKTSKSSNVSRKRQKATKRTATVDPSNTTTTTTTTTAMLNEPDSLRLSVYEKFVRHFCHIFNDHDSMSMLYLVFYPCCTHNLVNVLRCWSKINPGRSTTSNPMGWFNYEEFHGLEDVTNHCRVAFCMNPDMTTIIRNIHIVPNATTGPGSGPGSSAGMGKKGETKAFVSFDGTCTSVIPAKEVLSQVFKARQQQRLSRSQHSSMPITTDDQQPLSLEDLQNEEIHRCFIDLYRYNLRTTHPQSLLTDDMPVAVSNNNNMSPQQVQALIGKAGQQNESISHASASATDTITAESIPSPSSLSTPRIRRSGDVFLMDSSVKGYLIIYFDEQDKVYRIETHYFEQTPLL
jgi:hypothetical protein